METAQQMLSAKVVVGCPAQRLSDLAERIAYSSAQYCAVLAPNFSKLIGLIRFSEVAARPATSSRILADLMVPPPQHLLKETDPVERAEPLMTAPDTREIMVVSAVGNYRGLITADSFTAWHLENERRLKAQLAGVLAEHTRLADFLEKKVNARIEQMRAALTEFESLCLTLSHDIRAPLRSVRGYADVLTQDHGRELSPPAREVVARIHDVAEKGELVAQNLLDRARQSFGGHSQTFHAIDLNEVFADAVQFLHASIQEKQAEVVAVDRLHAVEGFYVPLLQIFINLVANALNSGAPGQPVRVTVRTVADDGTVTLQVQDNGVGLVDLNPTAPAAPFAHSSGSGSGLGLSIVRAAVQELGGRLEAAPAPERGTIISVILRSSRQATPGASAR